MAYPFLYFLGNAAGYLGLPAWLFVACAILVLAMTFFYMIATPSAVFLLMLLTISIGYGVLSGHFGEGWFKRCRRDVATAMPWRRPKSLQPTQVEVSNTSSWALPHPDSKLSTKSEIIRKEVQIKDRVDEDWILCETIRIRRKHGFNPEQINTVRKDLIRGRRQLQQKEQEEAERRREKEVSNSKQLAVYNETKRRELETQRKREEEEKKRIEFEEIKRLEDLRRKEIERQRSLQLAERQRILLERRRVKLEETWRREYEARIRFELEENVRNAEFAEERMELEEGRRIELEIVQRRELEARKKLEQEERQRVEVERQRLELEPAEKQRVEKEKAELSLCDIKLSRDPDPTLKRSSRDNDGDTDTADEFHIQAEEKALFHRGETTVEKLWTSCAARLRTEYENKKTDRERLIQLGYYTPAQILEMEKKEDERKVETKRRRWRKQQDDAEAREELGKWLEEDSIKREEYGKLGLREREYWGVGGGMGMPKEMRKKGLSWGRGLKGKMVVREDDEEEEDFINLNGGM
ncbi:hypothetical protein RUND412_007372 [Rhizina undulata]